MFSAAKIAAPTSSGYNLTNSLRFRASASANLTRTFTTPTSSTVFTWSGWVKRGLLGTTQYLFGASTTTNFGFNSSNQLVLTLSGTTAATTSGAWTDPSGWYHVVYVQNGSAQTIYVNSVSRATGTTANTVFNTAIAHQTASANSANYFDGYLAEVNFIDGQALTPSSFGSFNATTGVWQPAKYSGTYGTNGFYLPFSNTASTTTLGYDLSGNSNNWTTNNISLTAGSTYDSMTDVPTLTSTTAANYAVLNPLDYTNSTPINGNLGFSNTGSANYYGARATFGLSTGKWYWEQTIIVAGSLNASAAVIGGGVCSSTYSLSSGLSSGSVWGFQNTNGAGTFSWKYDNGTGTNTYSVITGGDVVGFALDMGAGTLAVYKNNTLLFTCNTSLTGTVFSFVVDYASGVSNSTAVNFGQQPFTYTPPTGFVALNAYNLTAGTVTTSGSFTGNASINGPFIYLNGAPTALTINGNAVTFGTHANKTANGFQVITSSASYNASGTNTYSVTTAGPVFKYGDAQGNP